MIIFKQIRWRNLSFLQETILQRLIFKKHNQSCDWNKWNRKKSTILDALTFVLFNKPFRKVNKSQLVNAVNEKDCVVEIEFINTKQYKVQRGIKPSIFEHGTDDGVELQNSADDRAMQKIRRRCIET